MQNMIDRLGDIWCEVVHDSPMWPIHGEYECRSCGRRHAVVWSNSKPATVRTMERPAGVVGLRLVDRKAA